MSALYVVGTPIGNLEDITLRAIRILKEVDCVLCEDTRMTKRLLDRYEIKGKKLTAYNERKSGINANKVIKLLEEGKNLALVSDAGTPGISDPGSFLVSQVRQYFSKKSNEETEVEIVAIPGSSALTSAVSIAGSSVQDFTFLGFLPHKKGRETIFKEIAEAKRTFVFYESPHRIMKTLESLNKYAPERKIAIARELTKIHEQFISGNAKELLEYFNKNKEKIRGEFVIIVDGKI